MKQPTFYFAIALLVGGCTPDATTDTSQETTNPSEPVMQNTVIEQTHRYELHSDVIDENFVIDVSIPPNADKPLPVIYLTDGNMMFPMVSSTLRLLQLGGEAPPAILVGIGYKESDAVMALRSRDLTPTLDQTFVDTSAQQGITLPADIVPGGADAFLDFIRDEVKPLIQSKYSVMPGDETLLGDSLGGLFAVHTLLTRTSEYRRYVAGSPSIWWDDGVLFKTESHYAEANKDLDVSLFISVGGLEEPKDTPAQAFAMVTNMHALAQQLQSRNYPNLKISAYEFEQETHLSVIPATFSRGLREVFRMDPVGVQDN